MTIPLKRPVSRDVGDLGLRGGDAGEYVVTLYPGGTLGLRRKRQRAASEICVGLDDVYRLACGIRARQIRSERQKKWKLRAER